MDPSVPPAPQQPLVRLLVKGRVRTARVDVLHPPVRRRHADVVVHERRAMSELWDEVCLRGGAITVPDELPVDEEVVRVVAGVHGLDVVVDERLLWGERGLVVGAHGALARGRVGRAGVPPAVALYFGEGAAFEDWKRVS